MGSRNALLVRQIMRNAGYIPQEGLSKYLGLGMRVLGADVLREKEDVILPKDGRIRDVTRHLTRRPVFTLYRPLRPGGELGIT